MMHSHLGLTWEATICQVIAGHRPSGSGRLAAELRSLRTSSGLTRDEIVERTGINVATLYRIEHARVRPQTRTLRTLLDLYGVKEAQQGD